MVIGTEDLRYLTTAKAQWQQHDEHLMKCVFYYDNVAGEQGEEFYGAVWDRIVQVPGSSRQRMQGLGCIVARCERRFLTRLVT